jgi:hypothetical protein
MNCGEGSESCIKRLEKRMEDLEKNRYSGIERGMERVGEGGGVKGRLKG